MDKGAWWATVHGVTKNQVRPNHFQFSPFFCTSKKLDLIPNSKDCGILMGSVQFSRSVVSDSLRPHELQHTRPPCPTPTPGVHSNSDSSSQ